MSDDGLTELIKVVLAGVILVNFLRLLMLFPYRWLTNTSNPFTFTPPLLHFSK